MEGIGYKFKHLRIATSFSLEFSTEEHYKMDLNSLPYTIFLYREELLRPKRRKSKLRHIKLSLTDKLITEGVRNLKTCSLEDLRAMDKQIAYKKKLQDKINNKKTKKKDQEKEVESNETPASD